MGGLRAATWIASFALHAALALPFITHAGGEQSAFEEGIGADLLKIEQGLAFEGTARTGVDAQNLDAIEGQQIAAVEPVPQTLEEHKLLEPVTEEPPPVPPEIKDVPELNDLITAKAEEVEESVAAEKEPVPEVVPQEVVTTTSVQELSVKEMVASAQKKEGGDTTLRTAYLGKLQRHINAHKVNPKTNRNGTVIVRFTVSAAGKLLSREITKSSGSIQLDQAALAALQRAEPFPPFPAGVGKKELAVSVPFRFLTR